MSPADSMRAERDELLAALKEVKAENERLRGSSRDHAPSIGVALDFKTIERSEYYSAWLHIFEESRRVSLALMHRHYYIAEPTQGWPALEQLRGVATDDQWRRLMDHALALASLDGNAFPDLVEQYIPEAWVNILWNGWADGKEFPALEGYSQSGERASSIADQVDVESSRDELHNNTAKAETR